MGLFRDSYDMTVGTEPMARKMNEVSQKVSQTTGAVGVMETAVIAQEKLSTDQICGKLDVGFFNVIMSQIAQRMANETAKTRALAIELMQQQKALQNLQNRMTNDYNMISARYAKLFGSLNTELKNRITELDKPVMHYCTQNVKQLQNRILNLVSGVPVLQSESLTATQAIAAVHLKNNAQGLIEAVAEYVKNDHVQRDTMQTLWNSSATDEVYYVPFIVDEEDTEMRKGAMQMKANQTLRDQVSELAYQNSANAVGNAMPALEWRQATADHERIANRYVEMVENSTLDRRVKEKMMEIFNREFQTL